MSAPWAAVRTAAARCALVLAVVTGAIAGQALWAPGLVHAEWCGPTMPQKVNFARGYLFTGVLEAKHPEGQRPPSWEFMVERIYAGVEPPPDSPLHHDFEEGETLTLADRCYPPKGLRIGGRYLVSIAAIGSFASQSTVVWEVLPHGRVRLLRQYGSRPVGTWRTYPLGRRVDPRILVPITVRQAVRLMTPPGELPPTDTTPPHREGTEAAPRIRALVISIVSAMLDELGATISRLCVDADCGPVTCTQNGCAP